MDLQPLQNFLSTTVSELAIKIAAAIAFWIVGRWLIGKVIGMIQAAMGRNNVDPTLTKYLGSIVAVTLNIALVLGILGYFGIQTTSFAAMLAGAGVAIGAAWSGMLGNFAAGAFMLVLRPFKVGDFVSIGGITGTVQELGLFGTTIITPDNVLTLVGNGKIFADTIQNFSALPVRRVERVAQLAGSVDPIDAIARFKAAVALIPNVAATPAPEVNLLDMNLNGPVIAVRPYTHRPLLAGLLRHERSDRAHLQGSGLAGPHAHPDHQDRAGTVAPAGPLHGQRGGPLQTLQDETRLAVLDTGVLEKRLHDEARVVRHIAHQHAQQVVHLAGQCRTFHDLRPGLHGGTEGVHGTALVRVGVLLQADVDVGHQAQAHVFRAQQRHVTGDDATVLQPLDAAQGGTGRKLHLQSQLVVGDAALRLQHLKNAPIHRIETKFCLHHWNYCSFPAR